MSKTTMRLVYVATPYAGLHVDERNRPFLAKQVAKTECAKVIKAGYTPISPILAFGEIYDEGKDRDKVIDAGLELLSQCSYVYFSSYLGSERSEGMQKEREYARELGISELDFTQSNDGTSLFG